MNEEGGREEDMRKLKENDRDVMKGRMKDWDKNLEVILGNEGMGLRIDFGLKGNKKINGIKDFNI